MGTSGVMSMRNPAERYTATAIVIHWLAALVIVALVGIGWFMVDLPKGPDRGYYFALHKSIGLSLFLLMLVRISWRLTHRPPQLPDEVPAWQRTLARSVHLCFYVLLVLQPVSGYLSSSFSGYRTKLFGIPLPHWGWSDPPLNELFTEIHVIGSIAIVVLVGIHLAGVLSHLLGGQARLVRRILPW